MGYELRVEREAPLAYAELANALSARAEFQLRGSAEAGEVVARHGEVEHLIAAWSGRLSATPGSDWQVVQMLRLAGLLGARLLGEDGEEYLVKDGMVEQVSGSSAFEFGKLDQIIDAGPIAWRE